MTTLLQQLENVLGSWDGAVATSEEPPPLPPPPAIAHEAHGANSIPLTLLSTAEDMTGAASPHHELPEEGKTADVQNARRALSRVELARAALALFASNAGIYRPVLQKVLSFLFRYLDFLVDERAQRRLSLTALGSGGAHTAAGLEEQGGNAATTAAEAAANDEVARAYQKIRLVEAKMQILVEEASAQRDRFRAQIAAHEQQEAKLTLLLQHQMELTDALLLHPAAEATLARVKAAAAASGTSGQPGNELGGSDVYYNAVRGRAGGGPAPPLVRDAAHVRRLITRAAKEKALEELELEVRRLTVEREANQQKITDLLKLNSQYARQAVELAARLSIIHDHNVALATDAQLYQRDAMQEQQRADKLARELLTARGILLAATEARSRELQLLAAERGSLTGLHPGRKNPAVLLAARETSANVATSVSLSTTNTTTASNAALPNAERSQTAVWAGSNGSPVQAAESDSAPGGTAAVQPLPSALVQHVVPSTAAPAPRPAAAPAVGDVTEMVESMVLSVQDNILRHQLQHVLSMQDVESPGAVKAALLALVNLHGGLPFGSCSTEARGPVVITGDDNSSNGNVAEGNAGGQVAAGGEQEAAVAAKEGSSLPSRAKLQLYELRGHRWSYPRGCHSRVPRHLRSSYCIAFYDFHPLVAECLVYELLSQRRRFLESGAFEDELNRSMAGAVLTNTTGAATSGSLALQSFGASRGLGRSVAAAPANASSAAMLPALRAFVPLDEFVELFVGIVWLNRGERLVRLLPEKARRQLSEYIDTKQRTSRQGHALFGSLTGRSSPAMGGGTRAGSMASQATASLDTTQARPQEPGGSFAGSKTATAPPHAQMQLSFNVHLQRMLHSMQLPEEMLRLSEEGLKLTYGIDVLSRSPQAGFLTYAFGVVSRNEVSEVLFEVMRSERAVLLAMCAAVEKERLQRRRQRDAKGSPRAAAAAAAAAEQETADVHNGRNASSIPAAETEEVKLQGCIPTVQLARILIAMFPTYPIARIEQLCIAAAEDATDSTENPVMVYYTVLLPLQQLPGAALISQSSPTTSFATPSFVVPTSPQSPSALAAEGEELRTSPFRRSGAFATLFYKSICDDALESLQMIEDSITNFAENKACMPRSTSNGSEGGGAAKAAAVTSEQLTTVALQDLPANELQQWGPALRGTLLRWALRFYGNAALVDMVAPSTATTGDKAEPAGNATTTPAATVRRASKEEDADKNNNNNNTTTAQLLPEELEACLTATHIPVSEVMPYLRRNLVPRRGPHPLPLSALVAPPAPPLSPSPPLPPQHQQPQQQQQAPVQGSSSAAGRSSENVDAARRVSESAVSTMLFPAVSVVSIDPGTTSLTARHEQEVRQKQEIKRAEVRVRRWSAEQAAYLQMLQHRWSAYAPANEPMAVELEEFMALLHRHDPRRGELWASEECGRNNHFLRTSEREAAFSPALFWTNAMQRPASSEAARKSGSARRKSFREGRRKSRRGSMASVKQLTTEDTADSSEGKQRGRRGERASTTSGRLPAASSSEAKPHATAASSPKQQTKERKAQARNARSAMLPPSKAPPHDGGEAKREGHEGGDDKDVQ